MQSRRAYEGRKLKRLVNFDNARNRKHYEMGELCICQQSQAASILNTLFNKGPRHAKANAHFIKRIHLFQHNPLLIAARTVPTAAEE